MEKCWHSSACHLNQQLVSGQRWDVVRYCSSPLAGFRFSIEHNAGWQPGNRDAPEAFAKKPSSLQGPRDTFLSWVLKGKGKEFSKAQGVILWPHWLHWPRATSDCKTAKPGLLSKGHSWREWQALQPSEAKILNIMIYKGHFKKKKKGLGTGNATGLPQPAILAAETWQLANVPFQPKSIWEIMIMVNLATCNFVTWLFLDAALRRFALFW